MEPTQQQNILGLFRTILQFLPGRRRKQFGLLMFCMALAAGVEMLALGCIAAWVSAVADPATVMNYIQTSSRLAILKDWLLPDGSLTERELIAGFSLLVVILVILKNGCLALITYWNGRFAAVVEGYTGEMLVESYLTLTYEWHTSVNSADLVQTVQWRGYLGNHFIGTILLTLSDLLIIAIMVAVFLLANPVVASAAMAGLGAMGLVVYHFVRRALDRNVRRAQALYLSTNRMINKTLHGIKDVKIFGQEMAFQSELSVELYLLAKLQALQRVFTKSPVWILEAFGFIILAGGICLMSLLLDTSTAKMTGMLALLAVTAWRVMPAVNRILSGATMLRESVPYIQKIIYYLGIANRTLADRQPASLRSVDEQPFKASIEFEELSFRYTARKEPALIEVSASITKGSTVGIIGSSGSGKSTLADIIIGLLPPSGGRMRVDGEVLTDEQRYNWRQNIGYVPQSPYILDGTIAQNVAFGYPEEEIDKARVLLCCQQAAMEFLSSFPEGTETQIGERGSQLSGGQQQRVSIARALYRNPDIIIFDEATSSLDSKSEREIQKTIYSFKGKKTLIIIAHRLTTVEDCDTIIWLQDGKVQDSGPPDYLIPRYVANQAIRIDSDSAEQVQKFRGGQ